MFEDLHAALSETEKIARERATARGEQLRMALRRRQVGDPVTMTLLGVTFVHFLAGTAIAVGLSIGTSFLMGALAKRQKQIVGDRAGQELSIQRSAQGTGIPEVYGGDPGDGEGGGVKLAPIVAWLARTADGYVARKHVSKSRGQEGKGGPKAADVEEVTYDVDTLLMWCRGPALNVKMWAATDIILRQRSNGSVNYFEAEDGGNALTGGAAVVTDVDASGGQAVNLPLNGALQWNGVGSDGSGVTLQFFYKADVPVRVNFSWNGSNFDDTLNPTHGEYSLGYHSAPWKAEPDTSNTVKIKNLTSETLIMDRLGVRLPGDPIGVPDPDVGVDPPYDPSMPPDAGSPWERAVRRLQGALDRDPDTLGQVGTVGAGNYAGIALYEGNGTELPDPTVQADVDGRHGVGSTPAYRHACTTRLANFYLTRYQQSFPPFWALIEHKHIRTFGQLCAHLSERVGLLPDEYDYSDLDNIPIRGVVVAPPYTPRELMTTLARLYNCYFYESDKIYGFRNESAPEFNLTDADLGWVDDDAQDADTLPELNGELPPATEITRRTTVRYISPGRNYEQDQQNEPRSVTTGQREDTFDVQVTLTDAEAHAVAAREVYKDDIESATFNFTLSYEHIYRNPGDIAVITRDEGFVQKMRITSIKPTLGVIECQAEAVEDAIFTQPARPPNTGFEMPPVPTAASSILGFYDNGALRTADENRSGYYAYVVKRTGEGLWSAAAMYRETEEVPDRVATFRRQATSGTCVTALGPVADTSVEDSTREIAVDAGTDIITLEDHLYNEDETVMLSNVGGALPAGLSATTLYYVINTTDDTLQLSLTEGGATINFTTAGTGTHFIQRVIDIDLYGTEATLETVTPEQIATGANPCLFGNEVTQVRTWERVTGFDNRWRGRNITRALLSTDADMELHTAGERFLLIDDAVQFIETDISMLNVLGKYHAPTAGQSYDDSAEVEFTWTGGALKFPPVPRITAQRVAATNDVFYDWDPARDGTVQEYVLRFHATGTDIPKRTTVQRTASSEPLLFTRDDLLGDGTPVISGGTCGATSGVATDGSYTVSSDGTATCRYVSQDLKGDCIVQFEADTRATPFQFTIVGAAPRPVEIDPTADTVRILGTGMPSVYEGQQVQFRLVGVGATLPGGVANEDAAYFIINYNGSDTFQVSATPGGAALNFTTAGVAVRAHITSGNARLETEEDGGIIYIQAESFADERKRPVPRESYAIEMRGQQARYFLHFTGDTRTPIFTSANVLSPNPFRVSVLLAAALGVEQAAVRPRVLYRQPNAFTYTGAMQDVDYSSSPPAEIVCDIRQINYVGNVAVEGRPRIIVV